MGTRDCDGGDREHLVRREFAGDADVEIVGGDGGGPDVGGGGGCVGIEEWCRAILHGRSFLVGGVLLSGRDALEVRPYIRQGTCRGRVAEMGRSVLRPYRAGCYEREIRTGVAQGEDLQGFAGL